MQALIIINSKNKTSSFSVHLYRVLRLLSINNYEIKIHLTKEANDIYNQVKLNKHCYDLMVIAGGDGSMNETLNALGEDDNKPTIMYFPTGTVNDLASSLGIAKNAVEAVKQYDNMEVVKIDSGKVNNKYFNYVCAFGPFTKTSYITKHEEKKRLGKIAYVKNAVDEFVDIAKSYYLKIQVDDAFFEGYYTGGIIANSTSVAGFRRLFKDDKIDDGYFNLLLVPKASPIVISKTIQYLLFGLDDNVADNDKGYIYLKFKYLKIECNEDIVWSLDGEKGPVGNIELKVINNNLKLIRPSGSKHL